MGKKKKKQDNIWGNNIDKLKDLNNTNNFNDSEGTEQSKINYKSKKNKKKQRKHHRFIVSILIFFIVCLVLVIGTIIAYTVYSNRTGFNIFDCWNDAVEIIAESSPDDFVNNKTSKIYDMNGKLMVNLSTGESSSYVTYDEIPEDVINAFISVEDRTFWENKGFSGRGIIRSAINLIISGDASQGGSTITQQLCKLTYLSGEKTVERKIKEIFLAYEMTETYSKKQIMEWYVNVCCFANGIYGIKDAARAYLDKDIDELSLSEICYLCAIPNLPEYYNPWTHPENALERRNKILNDMYECEYITATEYYAALAEVIGVTSGSEETNYDFAATYAISCAVEVLMEQDGFVFQNEFNSDAKYKEYQKEYDEAYSLAKDKLYTGGYTVYTSIDPEIQTQLQNDIDYELIGYTDRTFSGSSYNLQASGTVIDNETGKVVAIVGGRSEENTNSAYGYNRAYEYARQPASAIKPLIVYLPALEQGYTADSKIRDIDVDEAYEAYKNGDSVADLSGSIYSLSYSVEHSLNGSALYLYSIVTPKVGMEYLIDMNFGNIVPNDYYLSAALGGFTYGTNTLEMANAYSTIANYGEYTKADCIISMADYLGNEIYTESESKQVYESDACIEMTDILTGVLSNGTAKLLNWNNETDEPAAGKTGTTNNNCDGWFIGYTCAYTTAIWVGTEDNTAVEDLAGGTLPAYIWNDIMLWLIDNCNTEIENSIFNAESSKNIEDQPDDIETDEEVEDEYDGNYEIWHLNTAAFIRDAPSSNSNILFAMDANRDVEVINMDTYWTQIFVDGQICYVYTPFLSPGSVENH